MEPFGPLQQAKALSLQVGGTANAIVGDVLAEWRDEGDPRPLET